MSKFLTKVYRKNTFYGMHILLQFLKTILGKNITRKIRPLGHGIKSYLSAIYFGFPSRKLTVIGITGTKGKTSTTILTGRLLNSVNIHTGYISTGAINLTGSIHDEFLNPFKMTTIDGFVLQKYLSEMVNNGCNTVVLEVSSQGLDQNRHWGVGKFKITTFLNLFPEHIQAHGSLENYLAAKGKLFEKIAKSGVFIATSEESQISNTNFMWSRIPDRIRPTITRLSVPESLNIQSIKNIGSVFKTIKIGQNIINTKLLADFEVTNLMFAVQIVKACKAVTELELANAISGLYTSIPGRMEFVVENGIKVGVSKKNIPTGTSPILEINKTTDRSEKIWPISILVDYAHEPESNRQLLDTLWQWKKKGFYTQVIHILSSDGAGRDDWKKPIMGKTSYDLADFTIFTTDNYDSSDNPEEILNLLSQKLPKAFELKLAPGHSPDDFVGSEFTKNKLSLDILENQDKYLDNFVLKDKKFLKEIDRRRAFKYGLSIASRFIQENIGDEYQKTKVLIVSTGVGSEQGLTHPRGKLHWDERVSWIEEWMDFEVRSIQTF